MNLYLLTQEEMRGYDTYDSCVVCAESEEEAQKIVPSCCHQYIAGILCDEEGVPETEDFAPWAIHQDRVKVKLIGIADPSVEKGVVIASYNAG